MTRKKKTARYGQFEITAQNSRHDLIRICVCNDRQYAEKVVRALGGTAKATDLHTGRSYSSSIRTWIAPETARIMAGEPIDPDATKATRSAFGELLLGLGYAFGKAQQEGLHQ